MSGKDYLQIWYRAQVGIALFCVCVIGGWEAYHGLPYVPYCIIMGLILIFAAVDELVDLPKWLSAANRWLQCLVQPIILVAVWAIMTREIIVRLQLPARGVMIMTMTYYIVMFAPMAGIVGGQLKTAVARLFYPFAWFNIVIGMVGVIYPTKFAGPTFFAQLLTTGDLGCLAFFLMAVAAMRSWEMSWPGIMPRFGTDFSWWHLALLLLVGLLYIFINGFSSGTSWSNLLTSYDFAAFHPTINFALEAFEAGVAEETLCRFIGLGVLLYAFRNLRAQVPVALIVSAVLFGCLHLANLVEQPLLITTLQVVGATMMGLYFGVVYLYTGQLWLAMFLHALLDFVAFSVSGTTSMSGTPGLSDWYLLGVTVVIFGGIAWWMMTGKRRNVVDRHARYFTGYHQRFGYRLTFE